MLYYVFVELRLYRLYIAAFEYSPTAHSISAVICYGSGEYVFIHLKPSNIILTYFLHVALNSPKHLQIYPFEFLEQLAGLTTHRVGCTRFSMFWSE